MLTKALLLLCLVAAAYGAWVETVYTATLTPEQMIPRPNDVPDSQGATAVCVLDRNISPMTLDCQAQHNFDLVVGGYLAVGARGFNGPTVYSFNSLYGFGNAMRQKWTLQSLSGYTVEEQVTDFLNGEWYMVIQTDDYPTGAIRGQVEHIDRVYARMDVSSTIPRSSGSSATGLAVGVYNFYDPDRHLAVDFVHNVQSATTTEIHYGPPGVVGPLLYSFSDAKSAVFHEVDYTIGEQEELLEDLHYLNIASVNNPMGEIRGQMIAIDYVPEIAFTSRLSGGAENPSTNTNARGCGLVSYDCQSRVFEYLVMHNVQSPTAAFVQTAGAGSNGPIIFSLSNFESPIYGRTYLTQEEEYLLYTRAMYFNVLSNQFSSGEIRGQITVDADWWAYLSGTNVVSPVSTQAVGCATFHLEGDQNRILDYEVHHSVTLPTLVTLNVGNEGQNGGITRTFPSVFSPIRGDSFVLDDDDLEALVNDQMYVSVLSEDYPVIGEIRGQIKRVNPCTTQNENSLTIDVVNGGDTTGGDGNNDDGGNPPRPSPRPRPPSDFYTSGTPISPVDTNSFTPRQFSTIDSATARFIPPEGFFNSGASSLSALSALALTIMAIIVLAL